MAKGRPSGKLAAKSRKIPAARRAALVSSLRKLEKRVGQKNLAKMIGVDPRSLRRYKQGTRTPRTDVAFKIRRAERVSRGLRKTKSVKKKRERAALVVERHPEVRYFEKERIYIHAETRQISLQGISKSDVPALLEYLKAQGAESAFFVVSGVDPKTGKRVYASTEIMIMDSFEDEWESLYESVWSHYGIRSMSGHRVDLIGVANAPASQEG